MTASELELLLKLPELIDALTGHIQQSNSKLREQVLATQEILRGLGMAPAATTQPAVAQPAPVPHTNGHRPDLDRMAEQEAYLASIRAQREGLMQSGRGSEPTEEDFAR